MVIHSEIKSCLFIHLIFQKNGVLGFWGFGDDLISNTPPFNTKKWTYEHDENYNVQQWPLHLDMSYDPTSPAGSASDSKGPVGDEKWNENSTRASHLYMVRP